MTTTASGIRQDQTPTTANPLRLWHEAVSRYLETRKGGPDRNTARTYGRTPRAYKDFALESGLNPWGADALIGYNAQQNGLRKANGGDLAEDTKAARLTHAQGFLRWGYIHGATPLTPEMVKGFIHKPRVKQLSPRDILDTSEVRAMPKVAKSAEDPTQAKRGPTLIRVIADAGLRVSEAVNLKADDVYLAGGKWYLFVRGKGDKPRDVEVSEDLAQELLALKVAAFSFAQYVQENRSQVDKANCQGSGDYKASEPSHPAPHSRSQLAAGGLQLGGYQLPPGPC
jgi:site-specific recombinase XerD